MMSNTSGSHARPVQRSIETYQAYPPTYSESTFIRSVEQGFSEANSIWEQKSVTIDDLCNNKKEAELQIIFLSLNELNAEEQQRLAKVFAIPRFFWDGVSQRSNGFYGHRDLADGNGRIKQHFSWIRFEIKQTHEEGPLEYTWDKIGLYLRCTEHRTQLLCNDVPRSFHDGLLRTLEEPPDPFLPQTDPYYLYVKVLKVIADLFDSSIWGLRNQVRAVEKKRVANLGPQGLDYGMMHELARHAIHSTETLEVAITSITNLIIKHKTFIAPTSLNASNQVHQDLESLLSFIRNLGGRSTALQLRLQNEINLYSHQIAQGQSHLTYKISKATQRDSEVMKTIGLVTLVFLPATFVSALFSTTFFNFTPASDDQPEKWVVSKSFWIYWVISIPLTALVAGAWSVRQYLQRNINQALVVTNTVARKMSFKPPRTPPPNPLPEKPSIYGGPDGKPHAINSEIP